MNKTNILLMIFIFLYTSQLSAATIKENSLACITQDYFNQMVRLKVEKDMDGLEYLFKNGFCMAMNKNYKASILESNFSGQMRVRVYAGKDAFELWTYMESIVK